MINLASTVPITEAEGPGKRFAVWVQGCPFRCPGCCNPQYLPNESDKASLCSPEELAEQILDYKEEIDGVTFIGGEPFSQAGELARVAALFKADSDLTLMIFTGYLLADLTDPSEDDYNNRQALLEQTDLLVDGQYIREQHVTDRRWIGSANQQVHFLTNRYDHLKDNWPSESNTIEIRFKNGELTINGFPHLDITKQSASLLKKSKSKPKPTSKG